LSLKNEIIIKNNEIAIINEILFDCYDDITYKDENNEQNIGIIHGYRQETYIVIGWSKVNIKLINNCFLHERNIKQGDIDELFVNMYSLLMKIAIDFNIGLKNLVNILLISNVDSFFINCLSTNDYKTRIEFQSIPSFKNIVNLVQYIVQNKKDKLYNNFAITTDATMPLIEMSSIFDLPTKVWKVGDPKQNCKKQLVIADSSNISVHRLYGKKLTVNTMYKNDIDESQKTNYNNINRYYIINKKIKENKEIIEYINIKDYVIRFRLFVFINMVCEEYGPSNVFLICPNKTFFKLISQGMRRGGKGISLEYNFTQWFQQYYPKDFEMFLSKKWLEKDELRSKPNYITYSFHITEIGGSNNDGEIQYYRGNRTIGTACDCRVMIAITSPSSPINSFDWLSHFYYEQNYMNNKISNIGGLTTNELTKALRNTELKSAFFQTISRVKDPMAKQPSIVFAWGIGSENYQWSQCEYCKRNEIEIYNAESESFYNTELKIQSDDIYLVKYIYEGKEIIGDLCYDCILRLNAKIIGISRKKHDNLSREINGIEDLMAFKIPIPHTNAIVSQKGGQYNHFLNSEYKMLELGRVWKEKMIIPSKYLLKMRDTLIYETIKVLKKLDANLDYKNFSDKDIIEKLSFPLSKLTFYFGGSIKKKKIKKSVLSNEIKLFGLDNLSQLNIISSPFQGKIHYCLKDLTILDSIISIMKEKNKYLNN
ncbi:MAG: hypothetical protein WC934_02995, partial [Acidithiobacillus sp.]|uniref:hypothetical protein n=1 Tax=Acidithiobacillus sp. TaxID=1872118 RepID=UPI00355E74FE